MNDGSSDFYKVYFLHAEKGLFNSLAKGDGTRPFADRRTPCHLTPRKLQERIRFIQEELDELSTATNLADQVDALVDIVYVALGTAAMMNVKWAVHFDEVHNKNMQKVVGQTSRGNKVDLKKPEGWTPPDHGKILSLCGYKPKEFFNNDGGLMEVACYDDNI
jgi:hypothetical protein